ncbi:MAG: 2-hydroxyacid dehydrogenase [Lachnospiraceae bacterium]|nr:2-hydroxyacid dehydrogenase [Lachnospiraceae bacterium]
MARVVIATSKSAFEQYGCIIPESWDAEFISYKYTDEEMINAAKDAEIILVGSGHVVSRNVIESCPSLKLIQTEGVGFEQVDVEAAKERGVWVCNNKGANAISVAEHAIGLMLAGLRRTSLTDRQLRTIGYTASKRAHLAVGEHDLAGSLVGLVGFGDIGKQTAKRLKNWGCKVVYNDILDMSPEIEEEYGATSMEFDELIKACDIISMHVPVTPLTTGMLGKEQFAAMKKSALVINTSRGPVIDQDALIWALENDEIYGAALDVVTPEPLPDDAPILNMSEKAMDKIIITPHVAGVTNEDFERMTKMSFQAVERVLSGKEPINQVY